MARRSSAGRTAKAKSATWSSASSGATKRSSSARYAAKAAESSRRAEPDAMKEKNITVVSRKHSKSGKTDWKRFHNLTDAEIEAAMARDPEWADFDERDWSEVAVVIPPKKKAISIRVDEDVLDFFK